MIKIKDRSKAIQDYYPENATKCFGCGRTNAEGMHIKTFWDGNEGTCHFIPQKQHTGYPGILYGGIVASLIECNSEAVSAAATYEAENLEIETLKKNIFFTIVRSNIRFHSAIPIDSTVVVKTKIETLKKKLVKLTISIYSNNKLCTTAETTTMRIEKELSKNLVR